MPYYILLDYLAGATNWSSLLLPVAIDTPANYDCVADTEPFVLNLCTIYYLSSSRTYVF